MLTPLTSDFITSDFITSDFFTSDFITSDQAASDPQAATQELDRNFLARVAGGSASDYELNPPSAVDYLWSNQGPIYTEVIGAQFQPVRAPDWVEI